MKKFMVPVSYTVSGHIIIEADNMQLAHTKAVKLNDDGVACDDIRDPDFYTEVSLNELSDMETGEMCEEAAPILKELLSVDTCCNVCMVPDHDVCANNPNCSCCCDTMENK